MTQEIDCNLCGGLDHYKIYQNLVVCQSCGLSFLSPRMDADGYTEYYQSQYDNTAFRCEVPERLKRKFLERVSAYISSDNVLDVGAGGGEYIGLFSEGKTALEPSPKMQSILKDKGIKCVSSLDGFNNHFDFVVLRHTLEHFLDPVYELKKIHGVMKPGASIYIAVPNSLPINRGKDWFRIAHTYYFSSYTLLSMLSVSGFHINRMESDREELWCIGRKSDKVSIIGTPDWLPSYQSDCFRKALRYRHDRLYRITSKIKNFFNSL